ncbi:ImmA/IrrE family metallo-endopeptidase [Paracoccus sp. SCSIO 75233]|uniref:ImmA/IrrE family metallo-endopeptidase n=1 Tax=Rhodobacterales TaxID=204455 RepID=UPI0022F0FF5B|nr:ImmA/IrrE family metallo-endopeptidase [Paracoccus sp. SCSIO 75233]WBU54949.1 ImmA/IrrE family metallo-endopeptidase [Paracoccus sp. SCSIO 75233]
MKALSDAEQHLVRYGVTEPGQIDLETIAWTMGAKVRYRQLESCEAKITGVQDKAIITVDDRFGVRRARFSLAHEIGHWKRHRNQILACAKQDIGSANGKAKVKEREADRYAAELIMPRFLFLPRMRGIGRTSFNAIDELAEAFDVSRKATALRFVDLSAAETMLICYGPNGRKWFRKSSSWPDSWMPRKDHDPDTGVMDLLFAGENETTRAHLHPASGFFGHYKAAEFNVYAHSVISGSRTHSEHKEVLTLLIPETVDMFTSGTLSTRW